MADFVLPLSCVGLVCSKSEGKQTRNLHSRAIASYLFASILSLLIRLLKMNMSFRTPKGRTRQKQMNWRIAGKFESVYNSVYDTAT